MPQPTHPDAPERPDSDPLLAFNAELAAAAESSESAADPPESAEPALAGDAPSLSQRLERAERSLDRALTDIASLRSDLQTLVAAVDDIRKRPSRRPTPTPAPAAVAAAQPERPRQRLLRRAAATAVVVAMLGAAIWGMAWLAPLEESAPPPIDAAESGPADTDVATASDLSPRVVPAPPAAAAAEGVTFQTVANVEPPPRLREEPARRSTERISYVGTLSIDADPGGEVFLNRKSLGRTPQRVEQLRAGSHLVWIERDGYRRWTRVVTVGANRVSRVFADLEPLADRR